MVQKIDISKLVDQILSNIGSIDSSGLYTGKAGLSFVLFEASRYLNEKSGVFYVDSQLLQYSYESNIQNEKRQFQDISQEANYILTSLIESNKDEYPEMRMIFDNFESLKEKKMLNAVEVISFF